MNLNKNNGKNLQKIENFLNYKFDFGVVYKYVSDADDDQISLQVEIVATNLETQEEKVFAFQNGAYDLSYNSDQEKWNFYPDASDNVVKSDGFSDMHDNDDDLIEYLNEYLNKYNYAADYEVDEYINL
ncbi:MAG: hypothetical protein ACO25K_04905 [Candidatus Fonsibacter ubiquis]